MALFDEPELRDTTLSGPGDLLCVFTDGLVEARCGDDMFGAERVAALLGRAADQSAAELSVSIVDAVHDYHGQQLADDLAVLLIRSTPGDQRARM